MTTYPVREDQALADALTDVMRTADRDTLTAFSELRSAIQPGNGFHVPHVPFGIRGLMAEELRATADSGHPLGDRLRDLAAGLDDSARARALNGGY